VLMLRGGGFPRCYSYHLVALAFFDSDGGSIPPASTIRLALR